jgi:hypothetical protein
MTMLMLKKRLAGGEHACACEFLIKKMLDFFENRLPPSAFPDLSKVRKEIKEHNCV